MPIAIIDLPQGLRTETKKQLVKQVYARSTQPTPSLIRGCVSVSGARSRPVTTVSSEPRFDPSLASRFHLSSVIAEACEVRRETVLLPSGKTVSTRWGLSFFREHPL